MSADGLDAAILLPAMAAGLLVLATHIPLGQEVLRRGIVFLDLAIAQFAALGILLARTLEVAEQGWQMQCAAFAAALIGAAILHWRERRNPAQQEALIGISFVAASSAAVLLVAKDVHGGEHLHEILVGQILWTSWGDLLSLSIVTALVLVGWWGLRWKRSALGFYFLFAVSITASVQVVGVYLVFASLIVPPLCAGRRFAPAFVIGASGYALGLMGSAWFDLPSGAAIVLALAGVGLAVRLLYRADVAAVGA